MSDVRDERLPVASDSGEGPLRHFRVGRRAVLTSLATGVGAVAFATTASAASAHAHHAAAATANPAATATETSALLFLDQHAFDTLAILSEQIVPGSRAAKVAEFLDRLLAVESIETQKHVTQVIGSFERLARDTHGKPWKSLTAEQATALLTKVSGLPGDDPMRQAFDGVKAAVAETYYSSEAGMKELGWTGNWAFTSPATCG